MPPELLHRLRHTRLTRGEIRALAAHLPPSEAELDALIGELAAAADEAALTALVLAMLAGRRPLAACHLPRVLPLIRSLDAVPAVAMHAQGDVVEALLAAVDTDLMGWEREGSVLLIAGWLCRNREPVRELPPGLIPKARQLARAEFRSPEGLLPLFALAHVTGNQGLRTVLENQIAPPPPDVIATVLRYFIEEPQTDPLAFLPEQADRVLSASGPLRRAVTKVGRNDPCPCGSGKKYKKCCFEKDQERLHHSTDVAGVTTEELDELPEPFLTEDKLHNLRGPKLTRLRIELLAPPLQRLLLERLATFQQTDALLAAWAKVGWRPDLENAWDYCLFEAVEHGQRDLVERLVALRGMTAEHPDLPADARLLLLENQPQQWLEHLERIARAQLEDPEHFQIMDVVHALTGRQCPALGALLARAAAITARPLDAETLFDYIFKVRDRLDLPPEDPAEWVLDRRLELPDELDEATRADLNAARRQMELAAAETARLRHQLAETRAQLERQERLGRTRAASSTPASSPSAPPANNAELATLRKRLEDLKESLKERHAERNALRRELGAVLAEADELRKQAVPADITPGATAEPDREEEALLGEEATALQPPRLPVFPEKFAATLARLPDHVARAALNLIGRLAAGEPAAFAGMRRLRLRHEIGRVRVAGDYRLLFKPAAGQLEILDLINRRDFERWLKTSL